MEEKKAAGIKATEFIQDDMLIGLGSGSTVYYFIEELGKLVREGLHIRAVSTSSVTTGLAHDFSIPLVCVDDVAAVDLAVDGVDEIDGDFNAIKGGGGALFREKVVAGMARSVVWIMDSRKLVDRIGAFPLPVEVLSFGHRRTIREMEALGLQPVLRAKGNRPFVTDNENYIADLHTGKIADAKGLHAVLKGMLGVAETGLFLNTCDRIVVGAGDGAYILENKGKKG